MVKLTVVPVIPLALSDAIEILRKGICISPCRGTIHRALPVERRPFTAASSLLLIRYSMNSQIAFR